MRLTFDPGQARRRTAAYDIGVNRQENPAMKSHRNTRHASTFRLRTGRIPVSLLCAKLGEDFELFSDRREDALECEMLVNDLVTMHDRELAADDSR
jgi:hypothetical protein